MPRDSMIRAVAVDVDGTLAGSDHRVSPRNNRALAALRDRGVAPIIITGRSRTGARAIARHAGLTAPVISCNGAVVEDPVTGECLWERHLDPTVVKAVLDVAERTGLTAHLWTPSGLHASERDASARLLEHMLGEKISVGDLRPLVHEPVLKAMVGGDPADLDRVGETLTTAVSTLGRSLDEFYEVSAPGASKAAALASVLERLDIRWRQCMGIGDGENDLEWLRSCGLPVAVANARPSVQKVAVEVIGHHREDAVAAYLERVFGL